MPSYLITGSSRGLGLGFATELLKDPNNIVIATARDPTSSKGLQDLKAKYSDRIHLIKLDVTNQASIDKAVKETSSLLPSGLDNLISNAGYTGDPFATWETMDVHTTTQEVAFSVETHISVIRSFHPLVLQSQQKIILVISSVLGSVELAPMFPISNSYSVARAALNMAIRKWSGVMKDGVTMALIHPGYVGETEVGSAILDWIKKNAPDLPILTIKQSAVDCVKVLNELTHEDHGAFYNHDGTKLPF
ncbi:hypothetical protein F5884DRAFT_887211 [Xylogone sp. PMI_703]|nr:hypothetical protein F5884DRAFT_887211 [Xylogone sp. PMI_703]